MLRTREARLLDTVTPSTRRSLVAARLFSASTMTAAERSVLDTMLRRAALDGGEVSGFVTGTDLSQLPKHRIDELARFSPLADSFARALGVYIHPADFDP